MNKTLGACLDSRENNFDFLRFVCALIVIFSHSYFLTSNERNEPLDYYSHNHLSLGELAVVAFFVISGLLITMSYLRSAGLQQYLVARMLRIYPALVVVIVITVLVAGLVMTTLSPAAFFTDRGTYRYLLNIFSVKMAFRLPGTLTASGYPLDAINGSIWTLPHELFCYLGVATVGVLAKRKYLPFVLLLLVMALFSSVQDIAPLLRNMYFFLVGALFYLLRYKIKFNGYLALLAAAVFLLAIRYISNEVWRVLTFAPAFGYLVMYLSFIPTTHVKNFAKNGDYSYGLYIWAFPVQQLVIFFTHNYNSYMNFLVSAAITLVLSYFSWHLVEKNALKLKKRIHDVKTAAPALPLAPL